MNKAPIKIYDEKMNLLASLENAFDVSYELPVNALWTASFSLPKDDPKTQHIKEFNYVELFDGDRRVDLFRVMPQEMVRDSQATITVECEHVLATLIDDVLFQYHQIGGLGVYSNEVVRYVLDRQTTPRWKLVECDFERQFE